MAEYNPFSMSYYKKNETVLSSGLIDKYSNMKPIYSTDEKLVCGVIEYNNKKYLVSKINM